MVPGLSVGVCAPGLAKSLGFHLRPCDTCVSKCPHCLPAEVQDPHMSTSRVTHDLCEVPCVSCVQVSSRSCPLLGTPVLISFHVFLPAPGWGPRPVLTSSSPGARISRVFT